MQFSSSASKNIKKDQLSGVSVQEQFKKTRILEHRNIANFSTYKNSAVSVDQPIFEPTPSVIQFTNYEPLQVKEVVLKLRNKDNVQRKVKVIGPDNKLFEVLPLRKKNFNSLNAPGKTASSLLASKKSQAITKPTDVDIMKSEVAPGMEVGYIVRFTPEAKIDYSCDILIETERERFQIPVKAMGSRAMVEFPDVIDFGRVPVKHRAEKPVMMRNVGEKATKWRVTMPKYIRMAGGKYEGILEVGASEQLVFEFTPQESRTYDEEICLAYDGLQGFIPLLCESHDDNVYLSKNYIQLDDTYITLYSQQYFQIANKSAVPVRFQWRAFPNDKQEADKKARLNAQLAQEEAEERLSIEQFAGGGIDGLGGDDSDDEQDELDSDDSYDDEELFKKRERASQRKIALVVRKFQNIRKQVDEDPMLFSDDIFKIEPLQGEIWPNQEMTICVTFRPQHPLRYTCTAFCNITCSEERLPLNLVGYGVGPKASLSMRECDIGDIFVNYPQRFDLVISNDGQIQCEYQLINYETPFGAKFQFDHDHGVLEVGARQKLSVTFQSDILGEFSETFHWQLKGSQEMLTLTFKGHVVAPTFEFSEKIINFGKVSYNFSVVKKVVLTNSSLVPIQYGVRIPGDGRHSSKPEFKVTPNAGTLPPTARQPIEIEFVPSSAQKYDMVLVIDLEGVGQDMISVPIRAECVVPSVRVQPNDFLEFKEIFLRHPRSCELALVNEDDLPARFEFVNQDEGSKRIAAYTQDHPQGIIKPKSTFIVNITLKTEILGAIRVPLYLKVDGHQIQFQLTVLAMSIGPIVVVDREEIDFGTVAVLKDCSQQLKITNTSDITAEYTAFTKQKNSIWRALQRHGFLEPKESRTIDVICNADECMRFVDTLHVVVNNGVDLEVALKARGQGSTLFCKDALNVVHFGTEHTHNLVTREFFLQNRGRKAQKITWARQQKPVDRTKKKPQEEEKKKGDKKKKEDGAGGDTESRKEGEEEEPKFIFSIIPETMNLLPKMGVFIQFRANAPVPGNFDEVFICQTVSGGDRKPKPVYTSSLQGDFVNPTLSYSEPKINFKYIWEKGVPFMPISKVLDIMNKGPLPTQIALKIAPPFSCNVEKMQLQPGKQESVRIDFEPGMNQDKVSDTITGRLAISHAPHPHRESVDLIGEMCFPNLVVTPSEVRFGCILNDTTKKKYITLVNESEKVCAYQWSFLEQEGANLEVKRGKKQKKKLPINQVFDILPVSGLLQPGESEVVEFTFYAGNGLTYEAKAVCSVEGGPNYEVPLSGESSYVDYKLSTTELDFGEIPYNDSAQKDFYIENIGKVAYEFTVNTSTLSRPGILDVQPAVGRCAAGEKQRITVKFFPGIPDTIDEMFLVEVAHFPAERFKIRALGIYAGAIVTLPRSSEHNFPRRCEEVRRMVQKKKISIVSRYRAAFISKELKPIPMPGGLKPAKVTPSGMDAVIMDCEVEADRRFLCGAIVRTMEEFYTKQAMRMTGGVTSSGNIGMGSQGRASARGKRGARGEQAEEKEQMNIDHLSVAHFVCDFGNMVVGSSKKKAFKLFNVGKQPVTFNFDKKALQTAGLIIEPDRANKLMPNCGMHFNVNFQTRKTAKFGIAKHFIDIELYRGPTTLIEFCANLTIPELHISTDSVEFGEVVVGCRKTVKMRLENHKEVPCHWSFFSRQDLASGSKDGDRFSIRPASGHLAPGGKCVVDVMFVPTAEKEFTQKLAFKVAENPKHFMVNARGFGLFYKLEVQADHLKLGPVLPYSNLAEAEFTLKNLMDIPVEVFSTDFDTQHVHEEELLRRLQVFLPPPDTPTKSQEFQPEPLYLSWRKPGEDFWPELREADERRERRDQLKKRMKEIDVELRKLLEPEGGKKSPTSPKESKAKLPEGNEEPTEQDQEKLEKERALREERDEIDSELAKIESAKRAAEQAAKGAMTEDYPLPVRTDQRVNTVIFGPGVKCGIPDLVKAVSKERRKGLVDFADILEWLKMNGKSNLAEAAEKNLADKENELQNALAEYEKQKKKLKKGQEMDPFDETAFKALSPEIMDEILQFRLSRPDCNGGAVFYNTEAAGFVGGVAGALKAVSHAVPEQSLQLVTVKIPKDPVDGKLLCYNIQKGRRGEGIQYVHEDDEGEAEEEKLLVHDEMAASKHSLSSRRPERSVKEETHPTEEGEQEEEVKDPHEIGFMTPEEVEEYETQLKEVEEAMAKLSIKKIEASVAGTPEKSVADGGDPMEGSVAATEEGIGERFITELWMRLDEESWHAAGVETVPEPMWPDPDKEPLPPPEIHQIVSKPRVRADRAKVELFKILTPVEGGAPTENQEGEEPGEAWQEGKARWVLAAKGTQKLKIKFFSRKVGHYEQTLPFEIYGGTKQFPLVLGGDCEFPTISSNFRNVFMKHKKLRPPQPPESYLSRCYVISEGRFDFGPLLVGKDAEKRGEVPALKKTNATSFRITNNGKYDLEASFALRQPPPPEDAPVDPKKGAPPPEKLVYYVEPEQLNLAVDQTENITVWCFPERAEQLTGELVALIKDNPNPSIFKLQCLGAKPQVELDILRVDFNRVLLNQTRRKVVEIKNVSAIPVNWRLENAEGLADEFTIQKKAGTLAPTESANVEIVFKTVEPKLFEHKLTVAVQDTEGYGVKQEPAPELVVVAEAFDITVGVDFPGGVAGEESSGVLDFEDVRVGEAKQREFKLKNNGKYKVKYAFDVRGRQARSMFKVTPSEGELEAGEDVEVKVKFLSLKREIRMRTSKTGANIFLQINEGESLEKFSEVPILVNVNAVYSKYSLTPLKNINFGPMMYEESRVRTFEIKNNGLFEFAYEICDFADQEAKARIEGQRAQERDYMSKLPEERGEEVPAGKGGKKEEKKAPPAPKKDKKAGGPPADALQLEQYLINPYVGTIAPGSSAVIQVTFNAVGAKFYNKTLAIDIANRDPADQADGITFELAAESCVPGINTSEMDSIFEEQTVIPAMDANDSALQEVLSRSFFVVEDNVFFFGTLVASKVPEGAVEKFKISNPFKIPCSVNFAVKPRQQSKHEGFAFEVSPESLRIPPHEHAYVKVAFKPTNMMPYSGYLEATVENGTDPRTAKLEFELRGEGTLPTLSVEEPKTLKPEDGTPVLKFRKTRVGQRFIQTISLKNEGPVQATVRFEGLKHDDFRFLGQISYTIPPKSYQTFDVAFEPKAVGSVNYLLHFETVHNPYERHKVLLEGEAYEESLMFEGLPQNAEDELVFGDCVVKKRKTKKFKMTNNTAEWMRVEWKPSDKTSDFKFTPTTAHIPPRASKDTAVSFYAEDTVAHELVPFEVAVAGIRPAEPPSEDAEIIFLKEWGDDQTIVRMVRPSELAAITKRKEFEEARRKQELELNALMAKDKKAATAMKKKLDEEAKARGEMPPMESEINYDEPESEELVESVKEPHHAVMEGTERNVTLKISALADYCSYELESRDIIFKPTLMYQTRSHKFWVKNTSTIALNYNWKIVNPETEKVDSGAYSIVPRKGTIAGGCGDTFVVSFSPHEIEEHFSRVLVCGIKDLRPGSEPLVIDVAGMAERPICHFELAPSVYREKKARDMTPIDSKYNIIEFESLGTKVKNTKRFMVINPTNFAYEFEWEQERGVGGEVPLFRVVTKKGTVLSGKKFEMQFEYTPDKVGTHESFWLFKIPSANIVQHFMVVGMVHEPTVLFETGKVNFGPLLLEGKNRETVKLVNQEHIPFAFTFERESVRGSPDYADSLAVAPMSGVVPPQSSVGVEVVFKPRFELSYNYNLVCNVKRKMRPLVLNVKGVGYTIHHSVFAGEMPLQPGSGQMPLEFGNFFVNEKRTQRVAVENSGAFNFDFIWKRAANKYVTIAPESGTVKQGERSQFEITYFPLSEHKLKNYKATLQIVSGPRYDFGLIGSARKPGIKLSFHSYDFGPSFVMRQPMKKVAVLEMKNHDEQAISIESLFEKTPYLDVQLPPGQVLLPTHSIEVPIIFTPREIKKYDETVRFDFNGIHKIELHVQGEGIPMVLELVDPEHHLVDFGIAPVGASMSKQVQLVNKSRRPVSLSVAPADVESWEKNCLRLLPMDEFVLKPREKVELEVEFKPNMRLQPFSQIVLLQVKDNEARKLFSVNGVSHGIELKLMEEVLGFGPVVAGSFLTKKVQLANFGDVGAKFVWDKKAYSNYFEIFPEKAYIPPHQDIYLEVTFRPMAVEKDIRCANIQCTVEGAPEPLKLTLMGACIPAGDAAMKELEFETVVRKAMNKAITIDNPSDKKWAINPTISMAGSKKGSAEMQYFTGPKTLEVPPKGKAEYEVVYHPLTMTRTGDAGAGDEEEEKKSLTSVQHALETKPETHEGQLFFPLPDGSALHYRLIGKAAKPPAEGNIQEEVIAKQAHFISLPVKNWLAHETQRFHVRWEMQGDVDPTTRILGANTIDIGGGQTKNYKLSFVTYKAGVTKFTLYFQNRKSAEFCSFEVEVKAQESDKAREIELAAAVRETASFPISLDNPLEKAVEITRNMFTIGDELVDIAPEVITIPAKSESSFEVLYRPLVVGEKTADVVLKSPELGEFKYLLHLVGMSSTQQRSLNFKAALGSDAVQTFRFKHFLKKPAVYAVKLESLDGGALANFKAEPAQVNAPASDSSAGADAAVNLRFEPNSLGDTRGILKISNADAGEYTCLLSGLCVAPSPQGPIKIAAGKPVNVPFRNPLSEKCDFAVHFDNPCFANAGKPGGPLDPGKEMQVAVKFEANASHPPTGRMIISAKNLPHWVYYLHGEA